MKPQGSNFPLWRKFILAAILPGLGLLAWHLASLSGIGGGIVPTIGEVVHVLVHSGERPGNIDIPSLAFSAKVTLLRVLIGFLLASALAIPLGLVMGRNKTICDCVSPAANMMRVVCPVAWIPVAILLFGIAPLADLFYGVKSGYQHDYLYQIQPSMLLIVGWGAFFPLLLASAHGARTVRISHIEGARLMGASRWHLFTRIVLPHALPSVVNGMRIGLGISWMVIIAAELYPGTTSGLGYTIAQAQVDNMQYEYAFAAILYIMTIGLLLNGALWFIEKRVSHWQAVER